MATPDDYVDIIASGYEWICPECESEQDQPAWTAAVTCQECGCTWRANPPAHAIA